MRALLLFTLAIRAAAQTTATIDIDTTRTTPVNPGFGGVNDEASDPIEYWDSRFNTLAARLNYGWVRFPGGITGDPYNWQTGEEVPSWVAQFAANKVAGVLLPEAQLWMAGKGGAKLIDAANRARGFGASLVICANGFTDTPASIGQMAAYAKANSIPVAVWELSNEAYNFPWFFANATAYLTDMKPYRDAIKAADPNAVVAVFFDDPGRSTNPDPPWDKAAGAYPNPYWDAVTYHYYPPQSTGDFSQWMADENAVLATKTDAWVTGHLAPLNPPGTKFLIREFNPSLGSGAGTGNDSLTNGTLYGGIYAAEFVMRMSTLPSVLRVGPHAITSFAGVLSTNQHYTDVTAAAKAGTSIDTSTLDFGFYYAAEGVGLGVLYGVINQAVEYAQTTVTGGATVAATGVGQIPALYAMTYRNAAGGLSVVVTNKSATPHQVTIRMNGSAAAGALGTQFATGTDPSTMNTSKNPTAIGIQTGSSANPVTVPPYSVMRVDLAAATAPAPSPVSASPASGSATMQTFTFTFSDSAGWQNLGVVDVLVNNALDGRQACFIAFAPSGANAGSVYLVDDAGDAGGPYSGMLLPGSGTVANSQCSINGAASSVAGSGNTLALTLAVAFAPGFGGNQVLYLAAQDKSTANSGWQALGTWDVPFTPSGTIAVVSLAPARGMAVSGTAQTFTATLTDSQGAGDFGVVNLLVNNFIDGRQACYLAYAASTNSLLLVDDAGDAGGPFAGSMVLNGGAAAIQNSQCSVSAIGSSAAKNANTLTLTLNIAFKSPFAGNRIVWVAGRDVAGGNNTGWQSMGTTTVQ